MHNANQTASYGTRKTFLCMSPVYALDWRLLDGETNGWARRPLYKGIESDTHLESQPVIYV
jgi:hypothetical protein